ncbi:MAG TPA: nuclear pore complex subunit [Bacteroidales bacterium]|jgi:hypothetical protein|nr:nuclear pore complex subunit [Bacteroidales bacterium]
MNPLIIEGKDDTPEIKFDKENAIFEISGRSLPEDVVSFYTPVYNWLQEYLKAPNDETSVKMKIDYFNSASHKAINEILELFAELEKIGKKVTIYWHYLVDDEDMYESGMDFADLTHLNFEYKSYEV